MRNLFLIILLIFIAFSILPINMVQGESAAHPIVYIEIFSLALFYIIACYLNIHILAPRLLFRNKYVLYACFLLGFSLSCVIFEIVFALIMQNVFHLPKNKYGLFAENSIFIFDVLSSFVCYVISIAATSLIALLQHWWNSDNRIIELEEAKVKVELDKVRSKIDSNALFEILDKAASVVISFPNEASRLLHELSKSLRRQLYESECVKPLYTHRNEVKFQFQEEDRFLNFLIEKRYRLARNLIFFLVGCIIGCSNIDPDTYFSWMELLSFITAFTLLFYLNILFLLPRLLLKNKLAEYIIAIVLVITIFTVLYIPSGLKEEFEGVFWLFLVSSTAQIGFLIAGSSAFVLFQHWARNERYIAKLEAATLRAELEQLQNQINPHFLFNMLNNILVLIKENPDEAVIILNKLSDMLKYLFNENTKKEVLLSDDIHFLTDFLNLEKIRRDRFEFTVSVENNADKQLVPPLLFIPFVENAVKHGNDAVNPSYIHLNFDKNGDALYFTCNNSKPVKPQKKNEYNGLGLINIRRRLELLYGNNYSLEITENEAIYTVQLNIKL